MRYLDSAFKLHCHIYIFFPYFTPNGYTQKYFHAFIGYTEKHKYNQGKTLPPLSLLYINPPESWAIYRVGWVSRNKKWKPKYFSREENKSGYSTVEIIPAVQNSTLFSPPRLLSFQAAGPPSEQTIGRNVGRGWLRGKEKCWWPQTNLLYTCPAFFFRFSSVPEFFMVNDKGQNI